MKRYYLSLTFFLMILLGGLRIGFSTSLQHFYPVEATPFVVDFIGELMINNVPCKPGDEIGIFNEQGKLCGAAMISTPGKYLIHVYGDDPTTFNVEEGAVPGDKLTFIIWLSELDLEFPVLPGEMTPFSKGSFTHSPIPPIWSFDKEAYGLNITLDMER